MSKGLVLAGGGARGSYHIGAWQALMELGFTPDIVTGTSVGSMNAALVAVDWFEEAKSMWLSLNDRDVLDIPSKVFSKESFKFVRQVATDRGMSISPLETMINRFLDEDAVRASKIKYGLVTVNIDTLKPLELTLEQIPQGKLIDYIMASSACFPLLKMKEIDGQKFIDGGYYDNVPANLAAKMGATEIVEVNLDGIGFSKRLSRKYRQKDLKIITVKSHHDLGSILAFSPEFAQRNIELGYLDTYKAFSKLEGRLFAFKLGEIKKMYQMFGKQVLQLLEIVTHHHPSISLSYQLHLKVTSAHLSTDILKFASIVEHAMTCAKLPIVDIYTAESVKDMLSQYSIGMIGSKYEQLLEDTVASRLIAPVAAADLGNLFLSLLQQVI